MVSVGVIYLMKILIVDMFFNEPAGVQIQPQLITS